MKHTMQNYPSNLSPVERSNEFGTSYRSASSHAVGGNTRACTLKVVPSFAPAAREQAKKQGLFGKIKRKLTGFI